MKVSRPTWFPQDSAGGEGTNRRREGPSSSGFSRGGYMATLKRASKSGTIRRPHKRSNCIRGEPRALIRHPWLQSPG